ncbi:alpha/beta fold hydrolase [Jiangella alkaliphila]|uniref:Pimeloyl-ACP methyl ester carboxylesterase n=1 Tax=Jiangella alkaliphila TaxID=419479 RepID=A0A1H2LCQ1_9ACTN|nr:alpha/beta fold hydrolase [Jiangella alkaliphila]SDU78206.1 Pimeloyl-ACP methyl ester carboxylesterase [Jiangella alkaliphila]
MDAAPDPLAPARERLLAEIGVSDRRQTLAGTPAAVLDGGDGRPVILLHGAGELAGTWLPVLGELARAVHVIAPDLPGHGASAMRYAAVDPGWMDRWLDDLIAATCSEPPVLVGRVTGGSIAARYAAGHPRRLAGLVLVDTTGLVPFEPDARFELAASRFLETPNLATLDRLMDFCAFDLDRTRHRLGRRWTRYAEYAVELARTPRFQAATGSLSALFDTPIPESVLAAIQVPVTLVWGRHDLATPVAAAEAAARRYGWPLHVIDHAGDDPPLDRPDAFLDVLGTIIGLRPGLEPALPA